MEGEPGGDQMGRKSVKEIKQASVRKSRERLKRLIQLCLEQNKPFWRRVAELLAKPRRRKVAVNLSKIERYADEGQVVLVPGKLLGDGKIRKAVTIAAFDFSKSAEKKVREANAKLIAIEDLLNKDIKNVKIII